MTWTPIAVDASVRDAVASGAVIAFSLSGGADSTVAAHAAMRWLDEVGQPRGDRVAIHADLGRAEWRSTPRTVEEVCAALDLPLMVVRRAAGDMVVRWESRFEAGKRRYAALEVFNLIGPWSSASLRFCTAELKQQVIAPALLRRWPGRPIVSVVGIRREELSRRNAPISKPEPRWARADGTRMLTWHPAVEISKAEVFARHDAFGLPLHEAYRVWGCSRVSCAFCVLQGRADRAASARAPGNRGLLRTLVALEARSSFSFQPAEWLADVAPELLPPELAAAIPQAKARAAERRALEAALPPGLRYVKGWPLRAPTWPEAAQIVEARSRILGHHGLPDRFPTPAAVIDRFRQLLAAKDGRSRPRMAA